MTKFKWEQAKTKRVSPAVRFFGGDSKESSFLRNFFSLRRLGKTDEEALSEALHWERGISKKKAKFLIAEAENNYPIW